MACIVAEFKLIERTSIRRSLAKFIKQSQCPAHLRLERLYNIPANSHACGLKTSISRQLTLAGQFLTPD